MSATWILSETETKALRDAHDAPSEATIFRRADLIAMIYCDPDGRWHLLLSVKHNERRPELEDVLDACRSLLPGIPQFDLEAGIAIEREPAWSPPVPILHLIEQRDPDREAQLQ